MNPYLAVFNARVRQFLQYRAAAFAGVLTGLFWGFLRIMVFTAFYHNSTAAQSAPMTLPEIISYIWLSQAMIALVPWQLLRDIAEMVRSGNVVYELTRPIHLYGLWFSQSLAFRFAPALLKAIPIVLIAGWFGLQAPPSVASAVAFLVALVGALILSAAITTLVTISLFWTVTGDGLVRLMPPVVLLLSGLLVPLPLFPDWLHPLLFALPFRGIIDTPLRLYVGNIPPELALGPLLHQVIWIVLLVALGCWLLERAQRRLEIHGG